MELLRDAVSINDLHRCHHSVCVEEQNDAVSPSEVLPGGGGKNFSVAFFIINVIMLYTYAK